MGQPPDPLDPGKEIVDFLEAIGVAHLVTANRVHASLSVLFRWAAQHGMADKGAMVGVKRVGRERRRERVLNDGEVAVVWTAAKRLLYPASQLVCTMLATGQRLGETSRMRWRDIQGDIWLIQALDAKNDTATTVPISSLAREILAECPQIADGFVFAAERSPRRPIAAFSRVKSRLDLEVSKICQAQGLPPIPSFTLHDIRRTVATSLSGLGVSRFVVSRILNHTDASVTAIYDRHRYDQEKREALELWARKLRSLTEPPPDNVTAFPSPSRIAG